MCVNMSLVEFKHSVLIGPLILSIDACSAVDLTPRPTRTRKIN